MIEIVFTARERQVIHDWIDHVQRNASLYGDDAIVFPDEEIVDHKLAKDGPLRFTSYHLGLILEWAADSPVCTEEKSRLVSKIKAALYTV